MAKPVSQARKSCTKFLRLAAALLLVQISAAPLSLPTNVPLPPKRPLPSSIPALQGLCVPSHEPMLAGVVHLLEGGAF